MIKITGRASKGAVVCLSLAIFGLTSMPSAEGFPSFNGDTTFVNVGSAALQAANPFSLTDTFVLELPKGDSVQVPGNLSIPPTDALIAPVSETGSTLAFLGLALLGLEVVRRRLRIA
jgi:hypothetical protein